MACRRNGGDLSPPLARATKTEQWGPRARLIPNRGPLWQRDRRIHLSCVVTYHIYPHEKHDKLVPSIFMERWPWWFESLNRTIYHLNKIFSISFVLHSKWLCVLLLLLFFFIFFFFEANAKIVLCAVRCSASCEQDIPNIFFFILLLLLHRGHVEAELATAATYLRFGFLW